MCFICRRLPARVCALYARCLPESWAWRLRKRTRNVPAQLASRKDMRTVGPSTSCLPWKGSSNTECIGRNALQRRGPAAPSKRLSFRSGLLMTYFSVFFFVESHLSDGWIARHVRNARIRYDEKILKRPSSLLTPSSVGRTFSLRSPCWSPVVGQGTDFVNDFSVGRRSYQVIFN